jgi:hypothetical protein
MNTWMAVSLLLPLSAALPAQAAQVEPQACSISIEYTRDGASQLTYAKDFVVSTTTGFSEDFSSPTRARTFSASLSADATGTPVVKFAFFADINAFDAVDFGTDLTVRDSKGATTSGYSTFYTMVQTSSTTRTSVKHESTYTLSCAKAK